MDRLQSKSRYLAPLVGALISAFALPLSAQEFPNKPIRWVVPFGPGTVFDIVARLSIPEMTKTLGQPIVIENRPGAGALVGSEYVAKNVPADGYTILMGLPNLLTFKLFVKDLRFDPVKDLVPAAMLVDSPAFIITNAQTPFKTFQELISYAKANPGQLNYGTSGTQSWPTLMFEAMQARFGVKLVQIIYKDGPAAAQAANLANQIQLSVGTEAVTLGDIKAGKLRPLVVSGAHRVASAPSVPSSLDAGYPDLITAWYSIHVPSATPKPIIDRISKAALGALNHAETRASYEKAYFRIIGTGPDQAAKQIAAEEDIYLSVGRKANIQPQ